MSRPIPKSLPCPQVICLVRCGSNSPPAPLELDVLIETILRYSSIWSSNCPNGNPTMYESYWRKMGNKCDITFNGDDSLSYFANGKSLCWKHNVVVNTIVDDHYIVIGTGSSHLVQTALYALSPTNQLESISVAYPDVTDFVRSRLHKWAGDARTFQKDGPYIEFITSPNNPDGIIRETVDSAYYWPQYITITSPANHDLARKRRKFLEISRIGVSKEAQLRAATILIYDICLDSTLENIFEYSQSLRTNRWHSLSQVAMANNLFVLQKYPLQYCLFTKDFCESHPGEEEACEKLLKGHKIHTRSGRKFVSDSKNVKISMFIRDKDVNIFLKKLMAIQGPTNGN
ncbi:hypothetical protein R3W88_000786 [Solanum pinnatisectum]|uniref:Alliinase C-terminal domain-containing protein n=1 Tax=Solanum pinnatisectum TaxID=50273 RepID=A0AAV9MJA1_9SOLN|nr:hypothetical protein R3W88_000786 [Solanum pinnatisectum]